MRCAEELSARIQPEHGLMARPFRSGMGGRISQSVKSSQDAAVSTAVLVVARWDVLRLHFPKRLLLRPKMSCAVSCRVKSGSDSPAHNE